MITRFGDSKILEVSYELTPHFSDNDKSLVSRSWGMLCLYVNGINLCAHMVDGYQKDACNVHLYWQLEWFTEKLVYILGHDPFPVPMREIHGIEMYWKGKRTDIDDEIEDFLWDCAVSRWGMNHCFRYSNSGVILPDICFWRKDNEIEISWNNGYRKENTITFLDQRGCYLVSWCCFKETIIQFSYNLIGELEANILGDDKINRDRLTAFRKRIRLFEYTA